MSDKDEAPKEFDKMLEQARGAMKRLGLAVQEEVKQFAADLGEPYTDDNAMYFGTMHNLIHAGRGKLTSGSPEIHALHDLARTVTPRTRDQWSEASRIVEELFDELDGGETLAFSDAFSDLDLKTPDGRAEAMRVAAVFHKVPASYAPALGDVVTAIMLATPDQWIMDDGHALPQPWASNYAYAVGAICARCKSTTAKG